MDTNWNWLQDTGNGMDSGTAATAGTGNVGLAEIACARGFPASCLARIGRAFDLKPAEPQTAATILGLAEPLTSREQQVLRLLAAGRANRDIAAELVVTLDTVKRHVTHILAKLGALNRTEAVARARELNLIP